MLDRINRSADLSSIANYARSSPARGGGGGLSVAEIYQISQLNAVRKVGALGFSASASDFSANFTQRLGSSSEVKISTAGRIQSSLAELRSKLQDLNRSKDPLTTANTQPSVLSAKALQGGKVQTPVAINVQQLAQSQQIQSRNFSPAEAAIGTGKLIIQRADLSSGLQTGSAVSININSSNNTLAGIAQAINGSGASVRATVLRDAEGSRLALTGDFTGQAQGFTIRSQDNDGNDSDAVGLSALNFSGVDGENAIRQAQDAKLTINSREVSSSSNTLADQASQLQLQLQQQGGTQVSLQRDGTVVSQKISDLLGFYNQTRSQLGAIGDVTASKLSRKLDESLANLSVGAGLSQLVSADIGLSRDSSGKLFINETRLSQQALAQPEALNDFYNLLSGKLETQLKTSLQQQGGVASLWQGFRSVSAEQSASQSMSSLLSSSGANFSLPLNTRAAAGVLQYVSIAQLQ